MVAPAALDPLDHLDASLQDFEPTTPLRFGYPSHHSGFRSEGTEESDDRDSVSAGGYSPPAWRRLENGDRSNGFWRKSDNLLGHGTDHARALRQLGMMSPESFHGYGTDEDDDEEESHHVLEQAIRTRLPTGSLSPEKGFSPEPERTLKIDDMVLQSPTPPASGVPDNCKIALFFPLNCLVHMPSSTPLTSGRDGWDGRRMGK